MKKKENTELSKKASARIRLTEPQKELLAIVGKGLLAAIALGGLLAVAIAAPNAIKLLQPLLKKYGEEGHDYDQKDVEKVTQKILKDHYVEIYSKNGKDYLRLTNKGRRQLIEYNIDTIAIKDQKWDGNWRLVMFDIPEKYKSARNVLRRKLREIGFVKMQKSAWICPYECQEEIAFISETYLVQPFVNYFVVSKVDNERSLRTIFGLDGSA